ncbi:MAG TPA: hypothetical protein VMF52_17030 [Steroidobacteraceae bacterium]|nr:hypothetical protein [Steroidobacteraceae bacterium]
MNRNSFSTLIAAVLLPVLANAGIDATMAQGIHDRELCVVDNIDAPPEFRDSMVRALTNRGYTARFVPSRDDCSVTMAFNAQYGVTGGWGPRRVLKSASMVVYRNSSTIASARFRYERSMFGLGSDGKADEVISQMVFKLLPPV